MTSKIFPCAQVRPPGSDSLCFTSTATGYAGSLIDPKPQKHFGDAAAAAAAQAAAAKEQRKAREERSLMRKKNKKEKKDEG